MQLVLWMVTLTCLSVPQRALADPNQGPGGPILVITNSTSPVSFYHAEILRAEGLNHFSVADIASVSAASLTAYDVVVLSKMPLTAAQAAMFNTWVNAGGNLIAMAPDASLSGLLGINPLGTTLAEGYLLIDQNTVPGAGIVGQTIQFHGVADLYALNGASALATLYSNATVATTSPAVTIRQVGTGQAAAFTYDLATSIVQTRQGNPAWAAMERDGFAPIRSDDKFFGNAAADPKADWIDLNKVAIPQADEQQRLLANLIIHMNQNRKPLPRFWYFPKDKKAVIVMTGDDHGNGGTVGRFEQHKTQSAVGCSLADWECIRATSYIYPSTPMTDVQAGQFTADGFEVGLHVQTGCGDFTLASLQADYTQQVGSFQSIFPSAGALRTQRHHCIVWSDWSSGAAVQLSHGMRLDTSFYYWPPSWVNNVPGIFTGSAMPMRFTRPDGSMLDVFMAATQMTDESGQAFPYTVDTLLDRAIGPLGYYGAYVVNAHTDLIASGVADAAVASAQARGVSVISAKQLLTWVDARNASSFSSLAYVNGVLTFNITKDPAAQGLRAMLPSRIGNAVLSGLTRGGVAASFTITSIKAIEYAFFDADAGSYAASFVVDATGPVVVSTTPAAGAVDVAAATTVSVVFSEAINPSTVSSSTFELRNAANALVASVANYNAATRTATLTPTSALVTSATYNVTLRGGATEPRVKDLAGNPLATTMAWSFTTAATPPGPNCPCSGWDSAAVPINASFPDPGAVEVGVKFQSDLAGFITGIRFYKGLTNTGTHVGSLWTSSGTLLASATFTAESASGWQQVNFVTPVAIAANTTYVASYHAPNGNYAVDPAYFAAQGVDRAPIHLLRDGIAGGNGVYQYAASSTFPSASFNASNYWVDVVFSLTGPPDTTAPTISTRTPAAGASGVSIASTVTVTFSEAIDPGSLTSASFELRNAANAVVSGSLTYNTTTLTATLAPTTSLNAGATYTVFVRGGAIEPRVKDLAGNPLSADETWSFTTAVASGGCTSPANPVVAENCLPGNPASEWDVSGSGDPSIQGYATDISVNRGSTVNFKVSTNATNYRFDIYRMGYYGGAGARKVTTVLPSATLPQSQPACLSDASTGLIDCGNWGTSGSWAVPSNAASGIYFAKLVRTDTGGSSHIVFIVRDDASTSDMLFQTSDTTWQAYNSYGGNSFYTGAPANRAYKLSYNRPFNTRAVDNGQDWVFNAEYPMVRWLEANGYHVTYTTGVDSDRRGNLIANHRIFLSVGHDEYWSGNQRTQVENARAAGTHLAFFSGNEIYWKTRWENSIDGSAAAYRTLVSYKETHANAKIDPSASWTGTWRDPRFSPPSDGGRPENALTGTLFMVNDGATTAITVPQADGLLRFWRNTSVATLAPGTVATLPFGTLGYEWDVDADNGHRPAGLIRMSSTTVASAPVLTDFGSTFGSGPATHSLNLYRHASGALVFGAGTVQWSWGLDATHDRAGTATDVRMQQATVNLFADMGTQPASLQPGLSGASASSDITRPASTISAPANGATSPMSALTISGTATDTGGVVAGVEVSVDGGATWRPATGRASWTFAWTPAAIGNVNIRSRAIDDSGNIEVAGPGITVSISAQTCPCTIWPATTVPVTTSHADTNAVNLGIRFKADQSGFITGIRFYKGAGNTGTHVGTLWSSTGAALATVTFTGETATGWQQADFTAPVAVTAGTVYVASYLASNGGYAGDGSYFSAGAFDNAPLHALSTLEAGGNGVYAYSTASTFPTSSYLDTNYWVDVVFTTTNPGDTSPPTVTARSPDSGATGVAVAANVTATFSEPMSAASVSSASFELRDATNVLVPAAVTYDSVTRIATLDPLSSLAAGAVYTATVRGGGVDPRVTDEAGNALSASTSWSFTTAAPVVPTVSTTTPTAGAAGVLATANVTATFSIDMDAASITGSSFVLRDAASVVVPAVVTYDAGTRVATLNPNANLLGGVTYTATVLGGATDPRAKSTAGVPLALNRVWSFTADAVAPTVTTTAPFSGTTGVSGTANITATFSEAVTASTVNSSSFELRDSANNLVPGTVTLSSNGLVATFNPTPTLTQAATYTATIRGGATDPRVKDLAGNALAANRVWSFTILADTVAPTITTTVPLAGATGVSGTANITATFSEAMTAATLSTSTFELRDPANNLVPGVVTLSSNGLVATFNPTPTLTQASTYTARVRGGSTEPRVKDRAGNALAADRVWSFTILPDTIAPTITSRSPGIGAIGVSTTANVVVTFSEAMNAATINDSTIELRTPSNALVAAVVTYNASNRQATLNPTPTLAGLTTYTVVVRGGTTAPTVNDVAGNSLATTATYTFITR